MLYFDFLQFAFLTKCVECYVVHLTSLRVKLHVAYRKLLLHAAGCIACHIACRIWDLQVTLSDVCMLYFDFLQFAFLTKGVACYVLHLTSLRVKLNVAYRTLLLHAAG